MKLEDQIEDMLKEYEKLRLEIIIKLVDMYMKGYYQMQTAKRHLDEFFKEILTGEEGKVE